MAGKQHQSAILLTAGVIAGLALFCLVWRQTAEPVYQGQPLSYWLQGYLPSSTAAPGLTPSAADVALDAAGTNAVPTLLRLLKAKDSALTKSLLQLSRKQHFVTIPYHTSLHQNLEAVSGFNHSAIAREGVSVAAWIEVYKRRPSMVVEHFAVGVLGDLGPAAKTAVPVLLRVASAPNASPVLRADAVITLGKIHVSPGLVVPLLLAASHDPNPMVRGSAIESLGQFGGDARAALDTLIEFLKDPDTNLQSLALEALRQINPEVALRLDRGDKAAAK